MIKRATLGGDPLRLSGAITVVGSVILGLFFLFALPAACTFVSSFLVIIPAFLFVLGGLAFVAGVFLAWKKGRAGAGSDRT